MPRAGPGGRGRTEYGRAFASRGRRRIRREPASGYAAQVSGRLRSSFTVPTTSWLSKPGRPTSSRSKVRSTNSRPPGTATGIASAAPGR